jgi:hypothetical protein
MGLRSEISRKVFLTTISSDSARYACACIARCCAAGQSWMLCSEGGRARTEQHPLSLMSGQFSSLTRR